MAGGVAMLRRLKAAREQRSATTNGTPSSPSNVGSPLPPAPALLSPAAASQPVNLQQCVLAMAEDDRPENTAKAMDPKKEEWMQFCDYVYSRDPYRHVVTAEKAYNFMVYQSFRELKKPGGDRAALSQLIFFDRQAYDKVMSQFQSCDGVVTEYPKPERPIGSQLFNTYRATLKGLFHEQQAQFRMTAAWEHVWLPHFNKLRDHVKTRKPKVKKETYQEKVDGAFAPYAIVDHYNEIEETLWKSGYVPQHRSVCSALRHRFCALYTTSGLLRADSIYQAELSDFQGISVDKNDKDIHPIFIMIMQMPFGKTNKGSIRYGRAMRHRDVALCCVGALSFYLMYRFLLTSEFANFTLDDWLDNSRWFDIKLLVDSNATDKTKRMQHDSYAKKIKKILKQLGLSCSKLLHLGRNLGAKLLDLLEEFKEEKRSMGQWSPDVVDNSYSSKLPMRPMRKLAGFNTTNPMYFNTRTAVMPTEELLRMTPIGQWCYEAADAVFECVQNAKKANQYQTALQFLKFCCYLNIVFLQDAAAILIQYPDRKSHPMYEAFDVLRSDQFQVSTREWSCPWKGCSTKQIFSFLPCRLSKKN
jgi:Centromere DNA-binding protein complex CBF3 subunit, domain 2